MHPHPQRQWDGEAAGAAAAVAHGEALHAALLLQPGQHLVHRLRVPGADVQLHLRTTPELDRWCFSSVFAEVLIGHMGLELSSLGLSTSGGVAIDRHL